MASKVQAFFSVGRAGWSETYYSLIDIGGGNLEPKNKSDAFVAKRKPLLGPGIALDAIRWSTIGSRAAQLFPYDVTGPFGSAPVASGAEEFDMPFTSVLVKSNLDNGAKRQIWLRGLPDNVTSARRGIIVDPIWVPLFAAFGAFITNSSWAGYVLDDSANLDLEINDVKIVDTKIQVEVVGNDYAAGERIRISRLASSPSINGLWTVTPAAANWLILEGSGGKTPAVVFDAGGSVKSQRRTTSVIKSFDQVRFTSKKVGRVFGQQRSRSRKARPLLPSALRALS